MKKLLLFSVMFCFMIFLMSACSKDEPQGKTEAEMPSAVVDQETEQSAIEEAEEGVRSGIEMGEEAYEEAEEEVQFGIDSGMEALDGAEEDVKSGMDMEDELYEEGKERIDLE